MKQCEKIILPLLKDNHNHTFTYALLYNSPSLMDVDTKAEALKIINGQNKEVNIILGWNDTKYRFDEKELADLPPSIICNISLHRYLISPKARTILKEKNKEIVNNIGDQAWVEKNLARVISFIASLNKFNEKDIDLFFEMLERKGVWYAEDMLVSDTRIIEYYKACRYRDRTAIWTSPRIYKTLPDELKKEIKGIKIFLDGAVEAGTAAISVDYASGGRGLLLYSNDELLDLLSSIDEFKKPAAIHAIGDMAIDQAADALEILDRSGINLNARIEHAQFISKKAAVKLKRLGVTLSMQPNFTGDSIQYADRLPIQFLKSNNPFRMLIDEEGFKPGHDLIFGSDGMPHGAESALKQAIFPPYEGQRLTLKEFAAGYCMPDTKNGSIEVSIDKIDGDVSIQDAGAQ